MIILATSRQLILFGALARRSPKSDLLFFIPSSHPPLRHSSALVAQQRERLSHAVAANGSCARFDGQSRSSATCRRLTPDSALLVVGARHLGGKRDDLTVERLDLNVGALAGGIDSLDEIFGHSLRSGKEVEGVSKDGKDGPEVVRPV